jgi:hypothetical protein
MQDVDVQGSFRHSYPALPDGSQAEAGLKSIPASIPFSYRLA